MNPFIEFETLEGIKCAVHFRDVRDYYQYGDKNELTKVVTHKNAYIYKSNIDNFSNEIAHRYEKYYISEI